MTSMMENTDPGANAESNNEDDDLVVVISDNEDAMSLQTDGGMFSSGSEEDDSVDTNQSYGAENVMNQSGAPVLSAAVEPVVNPNNALRSPPKLQPAVLGNESAGEDLLTAARMLKGSMKNTPASLSIINAPSSASGLSVRSTRSSIDPSFAAKQRIFLNRVHNALSSGQTEDTTSGESDQEVLQNDDVSNKKSPEYSPDIEDLQVKRTIALSNGAMKRRREEIVAKGKTLGASEEPTFNVNLIKEKVDHDSSPKKRCLIASPNGKEKPCDIYCWACHRDCPELLCASCPRAYHARCVRRSVPANTVSWVCPECVSVLRAENQETRSKALKMLTLDQLCKLLLFAVDRMKCCSGADIFVNPVDPTQFPSYPDHIINPMHLSLLEKNIRRKMYGSTEAFVADASWIVHNCIIFNSFNSKLTSIAKNILKVCKQEMAEIENCPDCYENAYSADENWFILVCRKPHVLVWAKLKGFPFWPAKAMRANSDLIDVRFFGAHDRAWVPARDCFLYSEGNPNPNAPSKPQQPNPQPRKRNPRNNLEACIEEVELHIKLLQEKFSVFEYAILKVPVNPKKLDEHLKSMLPLYNFSTPSEESSPAKAPTKSLTSTKRSLDAPQASMTPSPLSKRVKKDSSSLLPEKPNSSPNDASPSQKNGLDAKGNCVPTVKESCRSPISKAEDGSDLLLKSTLKPRVNQTKETAVSPPESIADKLLKKKDVRKIGLVDRIQEKIASWVAQGPSSVSADSNVEHKTSSNSQRDQKENSDDVKSNEKDDNEEASVEKFPSTGGDSDKINSLDVIQTPCDDELSKTEQEVECKQKDFDSAKSIDGATKESMNKLLKCYNISKTQPKVVLRKLVLAPKSNDSIKSLESKKDANNPVKNEVKAPCEKAVVPCKPANTLNFAEVEKVTVAKIEVISDSEEDSSDQTSLPVSQAIFNRSSVPSSDCVVEPTLPSVKQTSVPKLEVNSTNMSPAKYPGDVAAEPGRELTMNSSTLSEVADSAESAPELEATFASGIVKENEQDTKVIPQQEKSCKDSSPTLQKPSQLKVSYSIRAKPLSELSDQCDKKIKQSSPKLDNILKSEKCDFVEPNVSVSVTDERDTLLDNAEKNDQLSAVKSILSPSVSVLVESSPSSDKEVTTKINLGERANSAPRTVTLNVKKSKPTVVVQTSKSPKELSSPKVLTSPTRNVPVATSILRINNPSSTSDKSISVVSSSSGQTIKLPGPQIINLGGHTSSGIPQTKCFPTFVTVSQGSSGIPIVRRILPKGASLPSVSLASIGEKPIIITTKQPSSSSQSQLNLNSSNTTSTDSAMKITASGITVTPITTSVTDGLSIDAAIVSPELKTQSQTSTKTCVDPLSSSAVSNALSSIKVLSPPSVREMPPLSKGSIFSVLPPSIQEPSIVSSSDPKSSTAVSQVSPSFTSMSVGNPVLKGPVSRELQSQANKMTEVFMGCIKDFLSEMGSMGSQEAQIRSLQFDIERLQWQHRQEIEALHHNTEILLAEMRGRMKAETEHAISIAVAKVAKERDAALEAIEATKNKQWCAFCKAEALFYCCWNTSYCDYRCQQKHWPVHSLTCTQNTSSVDHGLKSSKENGETQSTSLRRIGISQKEVLSPPLLKKC